VPELCSYYLTTRYFDTEKWCVVEYASGRVFKAREAKAEKSGWSGNVFNSRHMTVVFKKYRGWIATMLHLSPALA
jgi:hypothetical protein